MQSLVLIWAWYCKIMVPWMHFLTGRAMVLQYHSPVGAIIGVGRSMMLQYHGLVNVSLGFAGAGYCSAMGLFVPSVALVGA